ncbi:MAG: hypothetical protein L0Y72_08655 [Gemmataceae bacterium]|nr:hypothetical protein [Gemmataceae bacterium]MCI0739101.1 hypothetical protein [Gemmataceae bacterium]
MDATDTAGEHLFDPQPGLRDFVIGTWSSPVRQTTLGELDFAFHFNGDGSFLILGYSPERTERYRRMGIFQIEGNQLHSHDLNEGEPIRISVQDEQLHLRFDDQLAFALSK